MSRFLTLSRCFIDCANQQMIEACCPEILRGNDWNDVKMGACEVYEYVDPPFRASYARLSLKNKREQFYKHSEGISVECPNILEEETEYYMYLIKSSLFKGLPLREIH